MTKMNGEIVQQLKNNPYMNAMHYFSIKIKYFAWLIHDRTDD